MLILKGNCGKSRVIDILADRTNSICFIYDDYLLIFDSFTVNSEKYSLNDFIKCISDTLKEEIANDKRYDYLLIYTNQNEEDLQEVVDWLNKYRFNIPCRDIILTCK